MRVLHLAPIIKKIIIFNTFDLKHPVCEARESPLRDSSVTSIARHLIGVRLNILTSRCNQPSSPPSVHDSTTRGEEVARVERSGGACISQFGIKGPESALPALTSNFYFYVRSSHLDSLGSFFNFSN